MSACVIGAHLLTARLASKRLEGVIWVHSYTVYRSFHESTCSISPIFSCFVGMPTIREVCETFGLTDVELKYSDAEYQKLTTYKLFQQHVRPRLSEVNPQVRMGKLMMLVAAKWRDFSEMNPYFKEQIEEDDGNTKF